MKRFQEKAYSLGSEILLTVIVKDEAAAKLIFRMLWSQIRTFDERFSRFKSESELSGFNAAAGNETAVSPEFMELLKKSRQLSEATDGLYNPFILPALQRSGYVGSWPTPEKYDKRLDYSDRRIVPAEKLVIKESSAAIPADAALDFGGIGKGYLLDQLAESLETQHVKDYWLSLGGDIVCGGFNLEKRPWRIGIADCRTPEKLLNHIENRTGGRLAVATSGITKRKGDGWHHIIDPRSSKPARTDIMAATLTFGNATEADVFATCMIIAGSDKAEAFMKQRGITTALLQTCHNDTVRIKRYGELR